MLRKMFATTAIAALMTAPVMAQDAAEQPEADQQQMEASSTTQTEGASAQMSSDINEDDVLASNFIGKTVYTSANDDAEAIGDVEDVILDQSGKVDGVVVSVGGFLGIGDKTVALPFDRISMEMRDNEEWLVADTTSEELNQMQEFDASMLEPDEQMDGTEAGDSAEGMNDQEAADAADTDAGQEMEEGAEDAAASAEQTGDEAAQETEEAGDEVAQETEEAGDEVAQETDQAMDGEETAETDQTEGDTAEPMVENDQAAAPTVPADGETMTTDQQAAAEQPSLREGMQPADMESISAENLIGTTVYGSNEESLGEIGDVILGEDKSIEAYVIDVGGFLGIGEKPVAISPDAVELMKQPESDDFAIFTKFTEEQLDQQAEYSEEEYENNPDSVVLK
ncbi:PRC-barrel domain-containing protein [Notoacmeibacter ruber]|uniref:PRC-barrel domain-containing protein n=1 Tax=Notoacmeibacter ruber TaxID=2670375 RepID=A0A3L7JBU0_9HYPH|nr:PRC-barrel domain-containing protein [Notoacmeibacter ruber]RLQ88218.1 hypothetical protein D8780_08385 [Notoacmeibacter ruber]